MGIQNRSTEVKGLVFDIRRFSTHDGPGIRTTVFTKGCPLQCKWCQNPEGLEAIQKLCYFKNKCIRCGMCIDVCPLKAISHADDRFICIDRKLCDLCGLCVEACPPQAIVFDSKEMTVREVVDELLKDIEFYGPSGGITLSGGDPFSQKEFTLELLKECKKHGLNTAIETCLYVDRKALEQFLPYIDLLIADFKVFDSELHNLYTGQDNTMIKDNFVYLFNHYFEQDKLDVLVRIPLIPEYTATEENLKEIARFLYSLSPRVRVELLNYNPLAQSKYTLMNKKFIYEKNPEMYKNDELEVYNGILASEGIMNIARE
jgi:pyruvate formate lyase activating enzyme